MAKQKFKITNWPTYNKALRQRGSLTVWLDESAIAAWTDSSSPEGRGRPLYYTDMAVTTVLMIKRVFNLSLRALQGFVDSFFTLMSLQLRCPDYSLVSRRAKTVSIANRLKNDYILCPDMRQRSIAGCYQNNVAWLYCGTRYQRHGGLHSRLCQSGSR